MLIKSDRKYSDYNASARDWFSIMHLAHMWQFENMSQVALKEYTALPNQSPVEKIVIGRKYSFPEADMLDLYVAICRRLEPLSVEEGNQVGLETLALIAQTREQLKSEFRTADEIRKVVRQNMIATSKSFRFKF